MRVIGYLESSFWTMRSAEFGAMLRVAYQHAGELDAVLARSDDSQPKPDTMLARGGERLAGSRYVEMRDGVAVVDVNGPIAKRMDMFTELCFGGTSTEKLMKDIDLAVKSEAVNSIVLNIDSPGGEAFGINELSQAIYEARQKKPVKAYVGGLGCSGAYWIASAADEVIIDRSAFLGSIGVVTAWSDDTEFYKALGIRREVVTSSNAPLKRLDFDNDEHRAELQRELDSIEKVFHKSVSRNRKVSVEQVINDFNKGGVLLGADAVKAGMADRTGSLEEVIKELQRGKKREMSSAANAEGQLSEPFTITVINENVDEGDLDMGFKEEFSKFAAQFGFRSQDDQTKPVNGDEPDTDEPNPAPDTKPAPAPTPTPTPAPAPSPENPADDAAAAAVAELARVKAESARVAAVSFAEAEITAGRLTPAEKVSCVSLYTKLAASDESALADFKAMQSARKPHGLTDEVIDAEANKVLLAAVGGNGAAGEARTKELLEMSPLGKAGLKLVQKA